MTAMIQAMVLAGGVAALSWEVVWQLQATLAFGVSAAGTALTLAATMGGMTLGSLAAGAWLQRRTVHGPLRLYGLCELVIGAAGLLMLPGFRLLEVVDARIYGLAPPLAPALHVLGISLLLGPATAAMGATVPLFQLIARSRGIPVSKLYAANTAGAAAGVLVLSFWWLPALGVVRSCALVASINAAVLLLSRLPDPAIVPARPDSAPPDRPGGVPQLGPGLAQAVVLCTGFVTFGLEVAWFRALRAAFWSTSSTFAIMLASVLIPLALGARAVPALRRRGVSPGTMLGLGGAAIFLTTPVVERMDLLVGIPADHDLMLLTWLLFSLGAVGPAVFCLATALPWCLEEYPQPRMTGWLYGLNTVGAASGSLIAAWLLLPGLGFAQTAWALGLVVVTLALFACPPAHRAVLAAAGGAALLLASTLGSSPGRDRLYGQPDFGSSRIVAHEEGPDFTTSVVEGQAGRRRLMIDGFEATSEHPVLAHYMAWMGSLPAILHPAPQRGLVICFGTGQTANALRREGLAAIDLVDVSEAVFELAPWFDSNEGVLDDPSARAVVMDGRAWLRRADERYDVITLEPMPPNFSGINSLYSVEFYEIMARRLTPQGVAAQWLPTHLVTPAHAASIARTFQAVFPDALLWFDPIGGTGVLVGRREGAGEPLGATWPGLERATARRNLPDWAIRKGLLLDRPGLARYGSGGTLITDDNQLLQFGEMRRGSRASRALRLERENQAILAEIAGHPAFTIRPPGRRSSSEGPAEDPDPARR